MRTQTDNMLGESVALAEALDHLSLLASIARPVLVLGERGTGKELAAERLHFLSPRWDEPFIKVNCAAMAETLLESELFGHEAGAFTGATRAHAGRFERAHKGTLLLDEIGTMSARLQEKLLRLIEYGEFERVGGQKTLSADVRVVGSTNADLRCMATAGTFRADLLDRLSFDVVHMPALRHRDDDIFILAQHFAMQMSSELGWRLFPGFSENAIAQLRAHAWPGNVRELKNAVERSLHRWAQEDEPIDRVVIDPFHNPRAEAIRETAAHSIAPIAPIVKSSHSPAGTAAALDPPRSGDKRPPLPALGQPHEPDPDEGRPLGEAVRDYEKQLLASALARNEYNQRRTAEALGLSYDQIRGLIRKHKLGTRKSRGLIPQPQTAANKE